MLSRLLRAARPRAAMAKPYQSPLVCHGHSRPIVELAYSAQTEDGVFLISASKGAPPALRARPPLAAARPRRSWLPRGASAVRRVRPARG